MNKETRKIDGLEFTKINFFEDERGKIEKIEYNLHLKSIFGHLGTDILSVFNPWAGTLRGFHIQVNPSAERKVVRCLQGKIMQYFLDLRIESPTFGQYLKKEIDADDKTVVTISSGIAHGYQTLVNDTLLIYIISPNYNHQKNVTINFFDKSLNIKLPLNISKISLKDKKGITIENFIEKNYND